MANLTSTAIAESSLESTSTTPCIKCQIPKELLASGYCTCYIKTRLDRERVCAGFLLDLKLGCARLYPTHEAALKRCRTSTIYPISNGNWGSSLADWSYVFKDKLVQELPFARDLQYGEAIIIPAPKLRTLAKECLEEQRAKYFVRWAEKQRLIGIKKRAAAAKLASQASVQDEMSTMQKSTIAASAAASMIAAEASSLDGLAQEELDVKPPKIHVIVIEDSHDEMEDVAGGTADCTTLEVESLQSGDPTDERASSLMSETSNTSTTHTLKRPLSIPPVLIQGFRQQNSRTTGKYSNYASLPPPSFTAPHHIANASPVISSSSSALAIRDVRTTPAQAIEKGCIGLEKSRLVIGTATLPSTSRAIAPLPSKSRAASSAPTSAVSSRIPDLDSDFSSRESTSLSSPFVIGNLVPSLSRSDIGSTSSPDTSLEGSFRTRAPTTAPAVYSEAKSSRSSSIVKQLAQELLPIPITSISGKSKSSDIGVPAKASGNVVSAPSHAIPFPARLLIRLERIDYRTQQDLVDAGMRVDADELTELAKYLDRAREEQDSRTSGIGLDVVELFALSRACDRLVPAHEN